LESAGYTIKDVAARSITTINGHHVLGDILGDMEVAYKTTGFSNSFSEIKVHTLIDYISARIPRCWAKEDRIPFVITLTISGIEYLFYEDTYVVQNQIGKIGDENWTDGIIDLQSFDFTFGINMQLDNGNVKYTDYGLQTSFIFQIHQI
jgi:hypothetical protein